MYIIRITFTPTPVHVVQVRTGVLRLLNSGVVRRRSRASRGACVVVGCDRCCVRSVSCVWFGVMSRRRDVLEESGARRRGCKGWREVCVMFSDVVLVVWLCASFALCVWHDSRKCSPSGGAGNISRRRDVLEESGACRRRCKGWREVRVMFSDVVLVVWLCGRLDCVCGAIRASAVRKAGPVSCQVNAALLRRAARVSANVKGDEGCVCSF